VFDGNEIKELVKLFERREVKLYHSTQYLDFLSYLELGGIPSRSLLEKHNLKMTKFISDENDRINNVWDKVFLNPLDFGVFFEKGNGIPIVYGPISFIFNPQALLAAENVAICLKSAGKDGFNREKDALRKISDVDRIFEKDYTEEPYKNRQNRWIKSREKLKEEFELDYASFPEISMEIRDNLLNFTQHLSEIVVDPYIFNGVMLYTKVSEKIGEYGLVVPAKCRGLSGAPMRILPGIVAILMNGLPALFELENYSRISDELSDWARRMREKGLGQQWLNYGQYLREGTLLPIIEEENIIPF
jgi:hypothetical protein